jgi:hypothetical protein
MHKPDAARMLTQLGADANALEAQQYDIVTIAAVADDVPMLKAALAGGGKATNITSPYQGTALIRRRPPRPRRSRQNTDRGQSAT